MNNDLCVILIAHNEDKNIGAMLDGLLKNYPREILEIIVVDDASTDQTRAIVESWMKRDRRIRLVERKLPCGVGRALRAGFSHISRDAAYVLLMDSDFTENISQVSLLINAMDNNGYDGVIGSRFIKGGRLIHYPLAKKIMNRLFHFIVKGMFNISQDDLTNNFKFYKTSVIKDMPWRSNDYAMNAETGIFPILAGYRIGEVPISWVGRTPQMGRSKFHLWKVGLSYVRVIAYARDFSESQRKHRPDR